MSKLAFDKSVRSLDVDGRLHVSVSNICMATVSPYFGREIPDADKLGLDPDRIYQLFRPPEELEKAVESANNIPILDVHVPVTPDDPQKDKVIGSTGTDAAWSDPYTTNSLVFWDQASIDDIGTRERVELSPAYRYTAVMTPGSYKGLRYDGYMTSIAYNHVALVEAGRQGPTVVVGDSKGAEVMAKRAQGSKMALMVTGAVAAHVLPRLAQDAKIDFSAVANGITAKNFGASKAKLAGAVQKLVAGKLAADANVDDVVGLLDKLESLAPEDDALASDEDDEETDEERKAREAKEKAAAGGASDDEPQVDKKAMDAAIAAAVKITEERQRAIRTAEREVHPVVGEVTIAADSAAAIYKLALDHMGVDTAGVPDAALGALYRSVHKATEAKPAAVKPALAADSKAVEGFAKRFPNAAPIQNL